MINIDRVHTLVYNIAAKQLQAFPSPNDFNSYANLANIDLFNYYNDEREKMLSKVRQGETLTIPPVLATFVVFGQPLTAQGNGYLQPDNYIYDQALTSSPSSGVPIDCKKVDYDKLSNYLGSTIDVPTLNAPIYVELANSFLVYPQTLPNVTLTYIRLPLDVNWGYTLVNNRPAYNAGTSVDFEWDDTEFYRLTARILKYMGVSIRDNELAQAAAQMEQEAS